MTHAAILHLKFALQVKFEVAAPERLEEAVTSAAMLLVSS